MATIQTTLHASYQAEEWGTEEALREVVSNALDGEERYRHLGCGKMELTYNTNTQTLTVRNFGVTVPAKALLMGTSESRATDMTIGQFGEGLPMALLVLARRGHEVVINNGKERWRPEIQRSARFGGEPVLVVKTRKLRVDRNAFEVKIGDIHPEMWEYAKSMFLRLDPDFDETKTITGPRGRKILCQSKYKGCIYNKGVFVAHRENLGLGYDLREQLNRDRSILDDWTLRETVGSLLTGILRQHEEEDGLEFTEQLMDMLFDPSLSETIEMGHTSSDLYYDRRVREKVQAEFISRYGEKAVAVRDTEEAALVEGLGYKPIYANPLLVRIDSERTGGVHGIRRRQAESARRQFRPEELHPQARENWRVALLVLRQALPAANLTFELVEFNDPEVGNYIINDRTVRLNYKHIGSLPHTLRHLFRGAAFVCAEDAEELLATALAQFIRGEGAAGMALELLAATGGN